MNKRTWLPILCLAAALIACGQESSAGNATPEAPVITSITDLSSNKAIPFTESGEAPKSYTPTPRMEGVNPSLGRMSNEELILWFDFVVNVDFLSSTSTVAASARTTGWKAVLEFEFQVNEYLKGTGPTTITAVVTEFHTYNTEAEARDWAPRLLAAHDSRWDDRQAILFLMAGTDHLSGFSAGRLFLGFLDINGLITDHGYSIYSERQRLWLPAASASSGARGGSSSDSTLFLLGVPQSGAAGGADGATRSSTDAGNTIGLGAMRTLVTRIEAEGNAGGTAEYRECVRRYYEHSRVDLLMIERGWAPVVYETSIGSGQPRGTLIYRHPEFPSSKLTARPATSTITHELLLWDMLFEGADGHIVDYRVHDYQVYPEGDTHWHVLFDIDFETSRPLPAGEYEFFYERWAYTPSICAKESPHARGKWKHRVAVTAPVNTVHEAMFDPVAIGAAVGADSSNGVLNPNAFPLDGTTTTISSLKWEDGAVSITLSPTASLADYAIDFIDITGATTLSLSSENASTTALTWTVPDKPWADGDLLMMRIHRPVSSDATLSGLALIGIDLAFSPDTTTYAATVAATTTQTTVTPTTNHGSASYVMKLAGVVDNDGTIDLAVGANVITVEVTAEDTTTTQTYTVTVTRATPSDPVTITLIPRVDGLTFFDIDIQWSYSGTCENYFLAITTDTEYMIRSLGFHPPQASSHYVQGGWLYDSVPDFWVVVPMPRLR